jgi:RNA polymerase sigma factor (TIGR02999 family)
MRPGDQVEEMVEETYAELHRLAANYIRREAHKSVQATELINEAYLRLKKDAPQRFENRPHFVAIAAIAMRRLLVERARARAAVKRGGVAHAQVTLEDSLLAGGGEAEQIDLIALDTALESLAKQDARQAKVVELRYFGGLSIEETGQALGISDATVKREWTFARAWLLRALQGANPA